MNNSTKWLLVLPTWLITTVLAWIVATIVSNLSRMNLFAQDDLISTAFVSFVIHALSSFCGVFFGTKIAPEHKEKTAAFLCGLSIFCAIITMALGEQFRKTVSMSAGWHVWIVMSWIFGAIAAWATVNKLLAKENAIKSN